MSPKSSQTGLPPPLVTRSKSRQESQYPDPEQLSQIDPYLLTQPGPSSQYESQADVSQAQEEVESTSEVDDSQDTRLVWNNDYDNALLTEYELKIQLNQHREHLLRGPERDDIAAAVSRVAKRTVTWTKCRGRLEWYKRLYAAFEKLRDISGFGLDHNTGVVTASSDVWNDYLSHESHKAARPLRDSPMPFVTQCALIFGNRTATGNHSKGGAKAAKAKAKGKGKAKQTQEMEPVFHEEEIAVMPEQPQRLPAIAVTTPAKSQDDSTASQESNQSQPTQATPTPSSSKRNAAPLVPAVPPKVGKTAGALVLGEAIRQGLLGLRPQSVVALALNAANNFHISFDLYREASRRFHDERNGEFEARTFVEADNAYRRQWLLNLSDDEDLDVEIEELD